MICICRAEDGEVFQVRGTLTRVAVSALTDLADNRNS